MTVDEGVELDAASRTLVVMQRDGEETMGTLGTISEGTASNDDSTLRTRRDSLLTLRNGGGATSASIANSIRRPTAISVAEEMGSLVDVLDVSAEIALVRAIFRFYASAWPYGMMLAVTPCLLVVVATQLPIAWTQPVPDGANFDYRRSTGAGQFNPLTMVMPVMILQSTFVD